MTLTLDELENLKPHPAALLIHRPTEVEYQTLKASIAGTGVVNPVITVHEGMCLDGNTRLRACIELGYVGKLKIREFEPATDGDPYAYVEAQNSHRRHLSDEQRIQIDRRVEAAVALRDQGLTYDEIAEKLRVSQPTARRLIRRGQTTKSQGGDLSESPGQEPAGPKVVTTKRGQRRPTTYAPRKPKAPASKTQPQPIKSRGRSRSSALGSSPEGFASEARRFARWFRQDLFGEEPQLPPALLDTLDVILEGVSGLLEKGRP